VGEVGPAAIVGTVTGVQRPSRRHVRSLGIGIAVFLAASGVAIWASRSEPRDPLAALAYGTAPERRYITIGTNDGEQFSDDEYRQIADNYDVVVFAKFHAGWDVQLHHEAARKLKELAPDIDVYAYMSTKYWFDASRWGVEPDTDWFLRDKNGDPIPVTQAGHDPTSKKIGYYVDVSNPAYRDWVLDVAADWMDTAPYTGVRFDAADPIGDYGDTDVKFWSERLTPQQIDAYNAGITKLLEGFRDRFPTRKLLFNGISPSPIRGPERGVDMLAITDGAMDESFCIDGAGELRDVLPDIDVMQNYADKSLQLRASTNPDKVPASRLPQYQRYCVGSFLMGWQPGSTYLNMGFGYSTGQLDTQPAEIRLRLGEPTGQHDQDGDLLARHFDNGVVYVNIGDSGVDVTLPGPMRPANGGRVGDVVEGAYNVPAHDAAFLLTSASLETPTTQ
jgi:hypothetical protein